MAGLKLMAHGGYVPRMAAHLLQDTEAQKAINTKLYAGDLRSWKKPLSFAAPIRVSSAVKSIFRADFPSGASRWLAWTSDVNVIKSPLANEDNLGAVYFTGDGAPKKTNSTLMGTVDGTPPDAWLYAGVPAPAAAPTLSLGSRSIGSVEVTAGGSGYTAYPTVTFSGGGGSGAAAVAKVTGGVVTDVVVTSPGTGYTSTPTIAIAGAGGSGATATALRGFVSSLTVTNGGSGGKLASITVGAGGSGYLSAPAVSITGGGGSGATATSTVSGGVVTGITLTNVGSGYTSDPTVTLGSGGSGGEATAHLSGNTVTSVAITNGGSGYTTAPVVTFSGGGGTGAAGTAILSGGVITGVNITSGGAFYKTAPTVKFSGGSGATATATRAAGSYSSAPTVSFSGGSGSGATANAVIENGLVVGLTITNPGSGYTSAPTVTLSGGGGAGATATASVNTTTISGATVTAGGSGYGPVVAFTGGGGSGATAEPILANGVVIAIIVTNGGTGFTSEPTVAITSGGGTSATARAKFTVAETRVYAYTNVSTFGSTTEESAPSPLTAGVDISDKQQVILKDFSAAPKTGYNITARRIYRSVSGSNATTLQFVAEIAPTATSYTDSLASASLGETIGTIGWEPPLDDMAGIIALPNQFLAGFSGDQLCFSEVNAPHAWPSEYRISLGDQIVGIAPFGQSIAVMTQRYPYIVTGSTPDSMTPEKIPMVEPCISKRSICSDSRGVMYASPNGLCAVGPGISGLVTGNVMLRDDFQKMNPTTFRSVLFADKYMGFFENASESITDGAMILDRNTAATPLTLTTVTSLANFVDAENADLYIVIDGEIKKWDADDANKIPYEWLSKRFVFNAPTNLGAIEVEADFNNANEAEALQQRVSEIIAANQLLFANSAGLNGALGLTTLDKYTLGGSILEIIPRQVDNRYLLVELRCDDKIIHSTTYTNRGVYRLPSGFKGQLFEVRITGNIELRYLKLAETVKELKSL
jgi:hypothetical protein